MDVDTECEPEDEGADAELHVYETRLDSRGIARVLRIGSQEQYAYEPAEDLSRRAAFVLMREYRSDRSLQSTTLNIKSLHVNLALRHVVKDYPGVDFNNPKMTQLSEPPMCLYHFKSELWEYAVASHDPVMRSHMDLCLRYMRKALKSELLQYGDVLESKDPALEHRHLWMVFKPGELIYTKTKSGTDILLRLVSMSPVWKQDIPPYKEMDFWDLGLTLIDHSQSGPRPCRLFVRIPRFEGCKSPKELDILPLRLHPEKARIRCELRDRGRKFLAMVGIKHLWYNGPAQFWPSYQSTGSTPLRTYTDASNVLYPPTYTHMIKGPSESMADV